MNVELLTKEKYSEWDEFCLDSDDAWFWHTSKWLDYTLNFRPELKSTSLSFMLTEDSRILAICPLLLETVKFKDQGVREFSFGGSATWAPAFANELSPRKRERVAEAVFDHIDRLARENSVVRAYFKLCPLAPRSLNGASPPNNYLMKHGYTDASLNTQIINLDPDLANLRKAVRKGHSYDINRGLRDMTVVVFAKGTSRPDFDRYRELHHKAAGRVTRPLITFEMQHDWMLDGDAVLLGARLGEKFIGFSYVFTYKQGAYYGSACNDPDNNDLPIGHILHWKTIEWLKENAFRYYEIGYQQYGYLPYDFPMPDELNISFFKRGFGGFAAPYFHGEKYYSAVKRGVSNLKLN